MQKHMTNKRNMIITPMICIFVLLSNVAITVNLCDVHAFVDKTEPSSVMGLPQIFILAIKVHPILLLYYPYQKLCWSYEFTKEIKKHHSRKLKESFNVFQCCCV